MTPEQSVYGKMVLLNSATQANSAVSSANLKAPTENPHVLLVVDQLHTPFGGGERVLLLLAAELVRRDYRVSVLTFAADQNLELSSINFPVYLLPLRKTYNKEALGAARELRRFLISNQVRIVQTFFESSDLWAGLVCKTVPGMQLIWSRRDMGILRSPMHTSAYKLLASLPDAVFTVSELVRQYTIHQDGIDPTRIRTIYNGINPDLWPDRAEAASGDPLRDSFHVTTVGNIRHVKGHDVLLRAASIVIRKFPDAAFSIAGDVLEPDYFQSLQALVRELNLSRNVHFLGGLNNLPEHLAQAALFALPSRSEGLSNALLEAMAASLPVVATRVGGNTETVQDGVTGLIVPSDDSAALAEAICEILSDTARARAMGAAGRRRILDKFSVDAMISQTTDVYKILLNNIR